MTPNKALFGFHLNLYPRTSVNTPNEMVENRLGLLEQKRVQATAAINKAAGTPHIIKEIFRVDDQVWLDAKNLASARSLLQGYEDGLAEYLNDMWARLISDLESRNLHDEFPQFLKLPDAAVTFQRPNRITDDSSCATLAQPLAASGTFNGLWVSGLGRGGRVR